MSAARNHSTPTCIDSLPFEVLSLIFHLVLAAEPKNCIGKEIEQDKVVYIPKYPEILSLVCHHWHQVAIGTPALWTHIDLVPHRQFGASALTRAKTYTSRAASSLLDIHIIDLYPAFPCQSNGTEIVQFLDSVATHFGSISLSSINGSNDFCLTVVQTCFAKCVSGSFRQLHLTRGLGSPLFIDTATEGADHLDSALAKSQRPQSPDGFGLSITSLTLRGLYLDWASKAYHGLVELDLGTFDATIPKSQLIRILVSSPGLRVLRFGLETEDATWQAGSDPYVHLYELEVLDLRGVRTDSAKLLLDLVVPGRKPLQLSFNPPHASLWSTGYKDTFKKFFDRSNVTKLHLAIPGYFKGPVIELFYLAPQVRHLALEGYYHHAAPISFSYPGEQDAPATGAHLEHLYLLNCSFDPDVLRGLQPFIQRHQVQAVTLWCFHHRGVEMPATSENSKRLRNFIVPIDPAALFLVEKKHEPLKGWRMPPRL